MRSLYGIGAKVKERTQELAEKLKKLGMKKKIFHYSVRHRRRILVIDKDLKIAVWNKVAEKFQDFQPKKLSAKIRFGFKIHQRKTGETQRFYRATMKQGSAGNAELYDAGQKDGSK